MLVNGGDFSELFNSYFSTDSLEILFHFFTFRTCPTYVGQYSFLVTGTVFAGDIAGFREGGLPNSRKEDAIATCALTSFALGGLKVRAEEREKLIRLFEKFSAASPPEGQVFHLKEDTDEDFWEEILLGYHSFFSKDHFFSYMDNRCSIGFVEPPLVNQGRFCRCNTRHHPTY